MTNVDWDPDATLPAADLRLSRLEHPLPERPFRPGRVDALGLDDQLEWLRAAGFGAEPTWSYKDLAVMRASRPQPR